MINSKSLYCCDFIRPVNGYIRQSNIFHRTVGQRFVLHVVLDIQLAEVCFRACLKVGGSGGGIEISRLSGANG